MAQVLVEVGEPQKKIQHTFLLQMAFLQASAGQEMDCGFRLNAQLIQGSSVDGLAVPAVKGDSFQVAKSLLQEMVHAQEFRPKRWGHRLLAFENPASQFDARCQTTPLDTIPLN